MRNVALIVSFVCCCSGVATAQSEPDFMRADFLSVPKPRAMAVADFDRDGAPDLAQAGIGDMSVGLWLNRTRTGGGFVRFRTITVGGGPFDMTAGDLNRDGWPDVVIANADLDAVTILLGTGVAGEFTQRAYPLPGANPRGVALGDRNRDGILDIIVTEYATGEWRILYGSGSGEIAREDRFGAISHPQGVVAADFNRDGWLDVAIAGSGINLVAVFYSTATGGLVQRNVVVGGAVNVLTTGDYNRDGWLDLSAVSSSNNVIYTLHGSASGLALKASTSTGVSPRGIAAVDVNLDGWLDLVTANRSSNAVAIHLGLASRPGFFAEAHLEPAGSGSRAIAAADFDADGLMDLVTANEFANGATLLRNTTALIKPGLVYSFRPLPVVEGAWGSEVSVVDLNHNSRPDLIQETGSLVLDGITPVLLPAPAFSPVAADLNRDGHQDLVAIDKYEQRTLRVFFGDGRGRFPSTANVGSWSVDHEARHLRAADVNRDGSVDLVLTLADWRTHTATLHVLMGAGDGTFPFETVTPLVAATNAMKLADVDRDARLDVVLSLSRDGVHDRTLQVLFGDGQGGFTRVADHTVPANIADMAVVDVNHDGRTDVVAVTWDFLIVMLGTGSGGLTEPISYPSSAYRVAVGDLDEDGNVDVVSNGQTAVWFGNGDGTFGAPQGLASWTSGIVVTDMNRDGLPDIVVDGSNGILLSRRSQTNTAPVADAGPDLTVTYGETFNDDEEDSFFLNGWSSYDADMHSLNYEWRDQSGTLLGTWPALKVPQFLPGTYVLTLRVSDGRGGSDEDTVTLTITPVREIVLHAVFGGEGAGEWRYVQDPTAASNTRRFNPDRGAPKVNAPLAEPEHYFDIWFIPDPTQDYKLWMRGKGENDHWANDSVWVQFDYSTDLNAAPRYRIGTSSGLPFNLEECSGCGISGWGWEDDGWGAVDRNGVTIRFAQGGWQRVRIQTREDGMSIDQIVLSAEKYRTARPGTAKNDTTILPYVR